MLPFKKILFPVDYSDRCRAVIPYVEEMAARFSAQLLLVHAYTNTNWLKQVEDREKQQITDFAAEAFPGRHVDSFLEEGEPVSAIHKVVRHQEADLVMLPTRGIDSPGLLSTSVTKKVLREVSAPVWTETGAAAKHHPGDVAYRTILCAVTFSEETEAVLRAAALLASSYRAQLSLVHVVASSEFGKDRLTEIENLLCEWKQRVGIDAPHELVSGSPSIAIGGEATKKRADLLVVGRDQAQGLLSQLWSHLYEIVCDSPCPVLSI